MGEVAFDVAELLADGGADLVAPWLFAKRGGEEVFAGFAPVGAGLCGFAGYGGMEVVDDALGFFAGIVEDFQVGGIGDVGGGASGVDEELAVRCGLTKGAFAFAVVWFLSG